MKPRAFIILWRNSLDPARQSSSGPDVRTYGDTKVPERAHQTVQTKYSNFTELSHEIFGFEAELAPFESATFTVRLLPCPAIRPDGNHGRGMRWLDLGLDNGHLLAIGNANHICLEVEDAGGQVFDHMGGHETLHNSRHLLTKCGNSGMDVTHVR